MIICCNTKYLYSKHVSTQLWHHINESTAMGSVSYNVIKLTDNSGNLNHLGKRVSSGLLIFSGKKAKFRGIFRGKFAEKSADFAGKKVKICGKIGQFCGIFAGKSPNSRKNRPISQHFSGKKSNFKGFSGQIHRKFGRFHGKFRQETISKKQPISLFFGGQISLKTINFALI